MDFLISDRVVHYGDNENLLSIEVNFQIKLTLYKIVCYFFSAVAFSEQRPSRVTSPFLVSSTAMLQLSRR
jgi:hypothetical protein